MPRIHIYATQEVTYDQYIDVDEDTLKRLRKSGDELEKSYGMLGDLLNLRDIDDGGDFDVITLAIVDENDKVVEEI